MATQKFNLLILLLIIICLGGCGKLVEVPRDPIVADGGEEDSSLLIIPCGGEQKIYIRTVEIKNLQTKLYIEAPWPDSVMHFLCEDLIREGIVYRTEQDVSYFSHPQYVFIDSGGEKLYRYAEITICNFPDSVMDWSLKPLLMEDYLSAGFQCSFIEGAVEVVMDGVLYVSYEDNSFLKGVFVLASLEKMINNN